MVDSIVQLGLAELVRIAAYLAEILLVPFVAAAILRFAQDRGVKITAAQAALLEQKAVAVVRYAEEQANKAVARGMVRPTGPEKLEIAKAALEQAAPKAVKRLSVPEQEILIESALNVARPQLTSMLAPPSADAPATYSIPPLAMPTGLGAELQLAVVARPSSRPPAGD